MLAQLDHNEVSAAAQDSTTATPARPGRESYAPAFGGERAIVYPGPRMQQRTTISAGSRCYTLKGMFVIDLEYLPDGEVVASHRKLPVEGHGDGVRGALEAFCEAFDFQYRNLVEVDSDQLTKGGIRRREAMESVVADKFESA